MRKVILALRGFNDLNSLEDKKVFWNSFINLQKNLPSNIEIRFILQNSNSKESKLYSFLFQPFLEFNNHDLPSDLREYKKYISYKKNLINQINFSLKESYYISSICSFLTNKKNKYKFDQLILLNYNLTSFKQSKSVFIYDNLLPLNKIYLRYSDYIDQGYPINLIILPKQFLEIFSGFNKFFLSSISNGNNFLNKYNIFGLPLSTRINSFKKFLFILKNYFKNFIIQFFKFIENRIFKYIQIRILRFILNKIKVIVNIPKLTLENSFVDHPINQEVFYLKNILPIKPILKYFIYENYLRNETRFISDSDFENYKDSYIIGIKNFILILRNDASINEKKIKSELYNLKIKPKFIIFVKKNKIILYKYFPKSDRFLKEIFFINKKDQFQNIIYVLFKIKTNNQFRYNPPILILNSLSSFKSCTDLSYLNSLLQFFIWEDISYISLISKNSKKNKSAEFPYLYTYSTKHKLNLDECIINFKLLQELKYSNPPKSIKENYNAILSLNNQTKLFL